MQVSRKHLFPRDLTSPVKLEVVGGFFKRALQSFVPVYRSFCPYWSWSLLLSFPISFISVFLFIRNVFFFSLLIYGGSLAYQLFSKKGWVFTLMNLDPHFFPVPTLSSYDPSFLFPCPSPIAKKNNSIRGAGWHNQIKTTQLLRKTWKGSPKVWLQCTGN